MGIPYVYSRKDRGGRTRSQMGKEDPSRGLTRNFREVRGRPRQYSVTKAGERVSGQACLTMLAAIEKMSRELTTRIGNMVVLMTDRKPVGS